MQQPLPRRPLDFRFGRDAGRVEAGARPGRAAPVDLHSPRGVTAGPHISRNAMAHAGFGALPVPPASMPSDAGEPQHLNGLSRNRAQFPGRAQFLDVAGVVLALVLSLALAAGYLNPCFAAIVEVLR